MGGYLYHRPPILCCFAVIIPLYRFLSNSPTFRVRHINSHIRVFLFWLLTLLPELRYPWSTLDVRPDNRLE